MNVGFIGLGIMGASMASNLQAAGHALRVHDIRRQAAARHLAAGRDVDGHAARGGRGRPTSCSCRCPARPRWRRWRSAPTASSTACGRASALFDLSTNSPALIRRIHAAFADKGVDVLDAPVSGGPIGAKTGKLAIWVGGDRALFDRHKPLLDAMGDQAYYVGPDRRGRDRQAGAQLHELRRARGDGRDVHAWA